jgi:hypothetical protein
MLEEMLLDGTLPLNWAKPRKPLRIAWCAASSVTMDILIRHAIEM